MAFSKIIVVLLLYIGFDFISAKFGQAGSWEPSGQVGNSTDNDSAIRCVGDG